MEDVFCLSFVVEWEYYGEMRQFELVQGGSSVPVTEFSREEYVKLYADWYLSAWGGHVTGLTVLPRPQRAKTV